MDNNTTLRTNFANGYVSTSVQVRTDWERYESSVADDLNCIVTPTGALRKRPGTTFLDHALLSWVNGVLVPPILLKFEFSVGQTYCLEFSNYIMRFWIDDHVIMFNETSQYIIGTPYSYQQIKEVTAAQYKDNLYCTHWDLPIYRLVRGNSSTHTNWWWEVVTVSDSTIVQAPLGLRFNVDGHNGVSYTVTSFKTIPGGTQESRGSNEVVTTPVYDDPISEIPVWSEDKPTLYNNLMAWLRKYKPRWGGTIGFPVIEDRFINLIDVTEDAVNGFYGVDDRIRAVYPVDVMPLWGYYQAPGEYPGTFIRRTGAKQWIGVLQDGTERTFAVGWARYTYNYGEKLDYYGIGNGGDWTPRGPDNYKYYMSNRNIVGAGTAADTWTTSVTDYEVGFNTVMISRYIKGMFIDGQVLPGTTGTTLYNQIVSFVNTFSQKPNNQIAWNYVPDANGYYIYRRVLSDTVNGGYYLVQVIPNNTTTAWDEPDVSTTVPDLTKSPITSTKNFDQPGDYPHVCTFHQQRFLVGSTQNDPLLIGGSVPLFFGDFSEPENPLDTTGAWLFRLASKTSNPIKHILPLRNLYVLSEAGAFINTASGSINRANVNFNQAAYNGASAIDPVIIDSSALYVPLNRQMVNSLQYSFTDDNFIDDNLLFAAQDILEDGEITSTDFLRPTTSLFCCTTTTGKLVCCTYIPRQQFQSWTHFKTSGDILQCISITNSEGYDDLYVVVKRNNNFLIEKFEDMRPTSGEPTMDNSMYLDSALSSDPTVDMSGYTVIGGLSHLEGLEVYALVDMSVQGPFTVAGGQITLKEPGKRLHVGLTYSSEVETLDLEPLNVPTLKGTRRKVYKATAIVEKTGMFKWQLNGGQLYNAVFQNSLTLGEPPYVYTGSVDLAGAVKNNRQSRVRFVSDLPLPFQINGLAVEIKYGF